MSRSKNKIERIKVRNPEDIPFPPMPTVAPQPKDFVPIIEKLNPDILAKLRESQVKVIPLFSKNVKKGDLVERFV